MKLKNAWIMLLIMVTTSCLAMETLHQPYILGTAGSGEVRELLEGSEFEIVGEYVPYEGVEVFVITSESLKNTASKSTMGGLGAVERVAVTADRVIYTNPMYWAQGFRLNDDLSGIRTSLEKILGNSLEFGSEEGLSSKELRKYHYMMAMPYFDDPVKLARYDDHNKAVETVEAGLKAGKGNTVFVYRVDIPGGKETVFGMGLKGNHDGADRKAMSVLNTFTGENKHLAYFPYEILVSSGKVLMLHGKFRIAISFPDLSMGQFMKIRGAPGGIKDAAKAVASGK